ncbi:alpha/beta fold hydrolase [Corynebacterium atypicum]|nr:alpha/beta hydrolase [Corynebacterium atypicum]
MKITNKPMALLRSWLLRLTPSGRRTLALEQGALHSRTRRPGLTDVSAEGFAASTDGVMVRWDAKGPGAEEPAQATVLFLHGFTLAGESFYRQVDHLRDTHPRVRCVAPDLRGHGRTGPCEPDMCTVDGFADDALAALADADHGTGPVILVGHSLGGLAAFNLLRRCPESVRRRIAGIVVVATSIEALADQGVPQILASPAARAVYEAVEASPKQADKFRNEATKMLAPGLAVGVFHRPTGYQLVQFHAAMIHETPLETFVGFFDSLQTHDELAAGEFLADVDGFIITGTEDNVTPASQARRIQEVWPRAKRLAVLDAGHMVVLEAPAVVNKALDLLLDALPDHPPRPE